MICREIPRIPSQPPFTQHLLCAWPGELQGGAVGLSELGRKIGARDHLEEEVDTPGRARPGEGAQRSREGRAAAPPM